MPRPPRPLVVLAALAWAAAGCVAGKPTAPGAPSARPPASARPAAAIAKIPADMLARAIAGRAPRAVDPKLPVATFVGKVRIISDAGGSLIGNNGAGIVANNGSRVVSNNGGKIVSDNGGGLIGKTRDEGTGFVGKVRYGVRQAAADEELLLADAVVTVHDAAGRMLTLPDGTPIAAVTDQAGSYKLEAPLPAEGVVLRVRLWTGGELAAMTPKAAKPDQPIDTATSLGAAFVLDRFVKGDQATYDKLPSAEAAALREAIEAARGQLGAVPKYEPAELVALTEGLQARAPAVAKKLADIKALLIGQVALGEGRLATDVAMPRPSAMLVDRRGHLLVVEESTGRIRDVAPDGTLATLADGRRGTLVKHNFTSTRALAQTADGGLLVAEMTNLYRVAPDGTIMHLAGKSALRRKAEAWDPARPAVEQPMQPESLAVGPDGRIWIADGAIGTDEVPTRLIALGPDGRGEDHAGRLGGPDPRAVAMGRDGTLVVLAKQGLELVLLRLPAEGPGVPFARWPWPGDTDPTIEVGPDGTAWVVMGADGRIEAVAPDGTARAVVAPTGGEPSPIMGPGMSAMGPDGTLYVADEPTARIYARSPQGAWRPVAGAADRIFGAGDLAQLALNRPYGVAFDDRGRVLFTESGGFAIKRFDGAAIETVAGTGSGDAGDGGPAAQAKLRRPSGLAYHAGTLWVLDEGNDRLRAIGPDGTIRSVVGPDRPPEAGSTVVDAAAQGLAPGERPLATTVAVGGARAVAIGPDGRPYLAVTEAGQVWRLAADGRLELVCGRRLATTEGRIQARMAASDADAEAAAAGGRPAAEVALAYPGALAFDAKGDLYVADILGARVWRLTGLADAAPMAHPFAGIGLAASLAMAAGGGGDPAAPAAARAIEGPCGLGVDRAGRVLVGCMGYDTLRAVAPGIGVDLAAVFELPPSPPHVLAIDAAGRVTVVAGPGSRLFADAHADDALVSPTGLAVGPDGRLAIADAASNLLRVAPPGSY